MYYYKYLTVLIIMAAVILFIYTGGYIQSCEREFQLQMGTNLHGEYDRVSTSTGPQEGPVTLEVEDKDLGKVLRERALHVKKLCAQLPNKVKMQLRKPQHYKSFIFPIPFPTFVAPKSGSRAFRMFGSHFTDNSSAILHMKTLVVRHPLGRLASVYRDKYLNGSPLRYYNEKFKNMTKSGQSWLIRWEYYWKLPVIHRYSLQNFGNHAFSSLEQQGYFEGSMEDLLERFGSESFTMTEFLQIVLRSRDAGELDLHWKPISQLCDPCEGHYKYVVHLENPEEINYLLRLVNNTQVPMFHKSVGSGSHKSDLHYYESVPLHLMAKIISLYKLDFELFDYDTNFI